MAKEYKNKKGATGKKYTTVGDVIKVTYTDGSTRVVRPSDASYAATKKAMEQDVGAKKWYKPAGNSKTTAETALGTNGTGAGVVTTEKQNQQYENYSKTVNQRRQNDITPKLTKATPVIPVNAPALQKAQAMNQAIATQLPDAYKNMAQKAPSTIGYSVESGINQIKGGAKSLPLIVAQDLLTTAKGQNASIDRVVNPLIRNESLGDTLRRVAAQQAQEQGSIQKKYGYGNWGELQQMAGEVGSDIVNMAPSLLAGGGTGLALLAGTAMGNAANKAVNEGAELNDAATYGIRSGAIEAGTELLGKGIPGLPGVVKGSKVLQKVPGNKVLGAALDIGLEGAEEAVAEALDPINQKTSYNPTAENATMEELARAALMGSVTSGLLKGAVAGANRVIGSNNNETIPHMQENEQKQVQKQAENAQTAQNGLKQPTLEDARKQSREPIKAPETEKYEAEFTPESGKNVQNVKSMDITPKLEKVQPKITLEMSERTFENVGDKKVKAYQQENPAVKPFYQKTADNLLADLQEGIKGGRDAGVDPETRNVTTMGGWQRQQSEPIEQMLRDGMTYSQIEDGLQRIVEDHGKENTANAKRAELYIDDAVRKGYRSVVEGDVSADRAFAYRGKSRDELQQIMEQLDNSFTGNAEQDAAIISEMEIVQNLLDGMQQEQGTVRNSRTVAENTTVEPEPSVEESSEHDRMADYEDVDLNQLPKDVLDFWDKATAKSGLDIRIVNGLSDNVNGMYRDGMIYLNANRVNDIATIRTVTAHEVYHAMKNTSEFRNLQDVALDFYRTINPNLTNADLARAKIEEYSSEGVQLTEDEAFEELAADFMELALSEPKVAERIWTEQPTLAQRILEFIQNVLQSFQNRKLSALEREQQQLLTKAQRMYSEGLQSMKYQGQTSETGETRYSIQKDSKGSYVNIDTDQEIFDDIDEADYAKIAKMYIQDYLSGNQYSLPDGTSVGINKRGAKKIPFAKDSGKKYEVKMRMTPEIENAISIAEQKVLGVDDNGKHDWADTWDYYKVRFKLGDGEAVAVLNIANTNTGEGRVLYDIKIEESGVTVHNNDAAYALPNSSSNILPENQPKVNGSARYSLSKDNTGKHLTKQQEHYFKNSKVRDENGNLKKVYHGSPNEFYEFDWNRVGLNGTQEGRGFYFTDDKSISENYGTEGGGGVREFYLKMEKPLNGLKVTMKKAEVKKLLKETDKFMKKHFDDEYFLSNYGDTDYYGKEKVINDTVNNLFEYNNSDSDILYDIINTAGIRDNEDTAAFMKFITEKFGYDGILTEWSNWETGEVSRIYVTFDSNNAKLTDNENPTGSPDIRYSTGSIGGGKSRYQEMVDRYGSIEPGENPNGTNRDVKVPKQTSDWDKTRQWTRTAMEAEQVDDITTGMIANDLTSDMQSGRFIYEPTSNREQVDRANRLINQTGWEQQAEQFRNKYRSGESMTADDIALGERLIQEAQKAGDYQTAIDLIADVAAIGTEAGRSVQALRILKRLTPEGQLMALKRIEQRINGSLTAQKKEPVTLPEGLAEEMLQARGPEKQAEIWDKAIQELANQVPATLADKINAWRYLAMLSNPKTHIRNMVGNATMRTVMNVKNIVQTGIETTLSPFGIERTASIRVPKEYREFAEWDYENNAKKMLEAGGGRYNDEIGLISQNKQIFRTPILEDARKFNSNLLEKEDILFKKAAYVDAMARYMYANKLSPSVMQNQAAKTGATYEQGQNFAVEQAKKATFQEASKLAQKLAEAENINTGYKVVFGALVPFKKTPINILKRGIEYSPVGIMNGLKKAVVDIQKGAATPAEAIDSISAGLTGTGIMMLGYFMASQGLLSAGSDDDDQRKARYDQQMGSQNYALVLPDGSTYTIDWLAPSVMPMMAGAELYNQLTGSAADNDNATSFTKALEAIAKVGNPVLEMSMLQGLTDALQSYNSGTGQFLSDFAISAASSYGGQFIPAPMGALARTMDETVRSSYAPKDSPVLLGKEGESFLRQQRSKLPVLSEKNEPSIDVWGNERKREGDSFAERAFHNFLNPGTYSSNKRTELDVKLENLYEETGDNAVLPKSADNYVTHDGKTYYKTPFEKTRYDTTKGQKSKKYVSDFVNSSDYRNMSDSKKAEIVSELYKLANYQAKKEMLSHRGVMYQDDQYEKVLKSKVNPSTYYTMTDVMSDITGDGQKDRKISYLREQKNAGKINDEQFWYMRKVCTGKFNKSEMASCPYDWIKQL